MRARMSAWLARRRSHEKRIAHLETELRALSLALALSPYVKAVIDQPQPRVPSPRPAHADEVPLFPKRRPKQRGHL